MSDGTSKTPVGNLKRLPKPLYSDNVEMLCRGGQHPAAEISEHAYRRGFQHGVTAAMHLMEGGGTVGQLRVGALEIAEKLRYNKKPVFWFMRVFLDDCYARFPRPDGLEKS